SPEWATLPTVNNPHSESQTNAMSEPSDNPQPTNRYAWVICLLLAAPIGGGLWALVDTSLVMVPLLVLSLVYLAKGVAHIFGDSKPVKWFLFLSVVTIAVAVNDRLSPSNAHFPWVSSILKSVELIALLTIPVATFVYDQLRTSRLRSSVFLIRSLIEI